MTLSMLNIPEIAWPLRTSGADVNGCWYQSLFEVRLRVIAAPFPVPYISVFVNCPLEKSTSVESFKVAADTFWLIIFIGKKVNIEDKIIKIIIQNEHILLMHHNETICLHLRRRFE